MVLMLCGDTIKLLELEAVQSVEAKRSQAVQSVPRREPARSGRASGSDRMYKEQKKTCHVNFLAIFGDF